MARREKSAPDLSGLRSDVAEAAGRLASGRYDVADLVAVGPAVEPPEQVVALVPGGYAGVRGVLVLTERRVLFATTRFTRPPLDLPLTDVTDVTTASGMVTGQVALSAGEAKHVVLRVERDDVALFARAVRQAVDAAEPFESASRGDPFEALEKLAALRDRGVITEAEFAAKKQTLLDRM